MKVMCIKKDPPGDHPILEKVADELKIGNIYTVVYEETGFIELAEFPHPNLILWDKRCFAPLSTISETTFEREYNKQQV